MHTPVTAVEDINDYGDYDPLKGQSGGTNIAAALQEADCLADEFLANESEETVPRSVVLVLMSDGVYNEGEDPVPVADAIKQNEKKTICATLFRVIGGDASEVAKAADALRAIASSPAHYRETYDDIESLRKFFEASVSASRAT